MLREALKMNIDVVTNFFHGITTPTLKMSFLLPEAIQTLVGFILQLVKLFQKSKN